MKGRLLWKVAVSIILVSVYGLLALNSQIERSPLDMSIQRDADFVTVLNRVGSDVAGESASARQAADYIVESYGNVTVAVDASTRMVAYRGRDPATVVQWAVDAGGFVYITPGTYYFTGTVSLRSNSRVQGAGPSTVIFLSDGANRDLFVMPAGTFNCWLGDLYLNGNRQSNPVSGSGVTVYGYGWRPILSGLTVRNCSWYGIRFTSNSSEFVYEPVLHNIDIYGSGLDGLSLGWCSDAYGEDIYVEACDGAGIQHFDTSGTWIHEHAYNNYGDCGILVSERSSDLRLISPHLDTNQKNGIILGGRRNTLLGASIFNNGVSSAGSYDGLVLDGAVDCIVSGCTIVDYQRNKTQGRPIYETGSSDYNIINGNDLRGNLRTCVFVGEKDEIYGNLGYTTDSSGTATIERGSTSVTVAHGCDYMPSPGDIQVHPTNSMGDAMKFYVSDITSTTFTIYVDRDPGPATATFAWSVDRHR